jgi:hypothetical protein
LEKTFTSADKARHNADEYNSRSISFDNEFKSIINRITESSELGSYVSYYTVKRMSNAKKIVAALHELKYDVDFISVYSLSIPKEIKISWEEKR